MSNPINGLGIPNLSLGPASPLRGPASVAGAESPPFQNMLLESLKQVDAVQESAQAAVEKGLAGGDITQVEVLTSMKKADLALRLMLQIRNKISEAYDEIKQLRM